MFFTEMEVLFLVGKHLNETVNARKILPVILMLSTLDAYPGYRAEGLLTNRAVIKVPKANDNPTGKKAFFAMGDNSTDSLDGRAWGFVPENEIWASVFSLLSIYQEMGIC